MMRPKTNEECLCNLVPREEARTWERPNNTGAVLLFTPRAGSSWLCGLLRSTQLLGDPQEYLNQELLPIAAPRFKARTETDYFNAIETLTASKNGRYCITATWGQIALCEHDFLIRYATSPFIYLRRRDILAQAISLYLAVETGLFHRTGVDSAEPDASWSSEASAAISRWWCHLLEYECLTDIQLAVRGIVPLRLYYEDMIRNGGAAVRRVLQFCGVAEYEGEPTSTHEQVGGAANRLLALQFTAERGEFIRRMNLFRPPLVT